MRLLLIALTAALMCGATAARASDVCYDMSSLEAEQGLRIHTELMIIALNCQHLEGTGVALNHQYEDFTRRHLRLIEAYEEAMRRVFRTEGKSDGEAELNNFRTMLANHIANEAVRLQPNVFCRAYSNRIAQANAMSEDQFRRWAQTVFPTYPITHRICPGVNPPTQAAPVASRDLAKPIIKTHANMMPQEAVPTAAGPEQMSAQHEIADPHDGTPMQQGY
ncbi:MAG: hypothetical protein H6865_07385 [Rhodospirillales bacterium]|nr:hypothetical protein [Alphaproteobacteria bacterium]MCB9987436.1 hypothetical protein [Rhodospirillales bacterium]USO07582.1 MAG: hypothetical protein H6866_09270 [Rhodospirillales bacterium]